MKIIKKGILPADRIWQGTCCDCGSIVEANQSELTDIVNSQRDGTFCWMKCPVCNAGPYNGILFFPKSVQK